METKTEVLYYIKDSKEFFVHYDQYEEYLYASNEIEGEACNSQSVEGANKIIKDLLERYEKGYLGRNVEFPLKIVKVTTTHLIEEL